MKKCIFAVVVASVGLSNVAHAGWTQSMPWATLPFSESCVAANDTLAQRQP